MQVNNKDFDHSEPLDLHKWSEHREVDDLVNVIWNKYFIEKFANDQLNSKAKAKPKVQFKLLFLNLYVLWVKDPELVLGISLTRNHYTAKSRYNAIGISQLMTTLVHHLHEVKLIELHKGSEAAKRTTRIWPSQRLINYFQTAKFSPLDIGRYNDEEVIILNSKDYKSDRNKPIEYSDEDHPDILQWREELQKYNDLIAKVFIDVPTLTSTNYTKVKANDRGEEITHTTYIGQDVKRVKRIFYRGDWNLGGRFHGGWWQQVGSDLRNQIYINDKPTVEIDFKGLHVGLLYMQQGKEPPRDPYAIRPIEFDIGDMKQRKLVKLLALTAINAKSEKAAYGAFRSAQEPGSVVKSLKDIQLKSVLDAFRDHNEPIKDQIATDKGVELMAIDGRITAHVIKKFTEQNIPVLSVHDSYIIQHTKEQLLAEAMEEGIEKEFGYNYRIFLEEGEGNIVNFHSLLHRDNPDHINPFAIDIQRQRILKKQELHRTPEYLSRMEEFQKRNNFNI